MSDTEIVCQDCSTPFVFSDRDQAFYEEKGFTPPKRCKPCREQRKSQQGDGGYQRPQRNENRSGGNRNSGGRDRSDRPMFDATCGDCGAKCQVPFQPKTDRPVYCRECFSAQRR